MWQIRPVAQKTLVAGFAPRRTRLEARRRHLVGVVAFDGVVLGDLATPCEVFGRVRGTDGRAPELARRDPEIDVDADVLYVDNGNVLTSAGAAAGFDLCLHLVRRDLGARVASEVARAAVMPLERAGGQAQFIVHEPPTSDGTSIGPLLVWLEQNVREDLSLSVIARRAGMSTRTLSRRFRRQVGTTPALWVARARVRHAQRLLETTDLSVERVAAGGGFRSSAVLREHFGQIVGTSPQGYRRSFKVV